MCIAIYKPEDKVLDEETLLTCWNSNSDGAGFMYAEDDKLQIQKGFMDFNSFITAYRPHQDKKCVIHFRIKTHGRVNEDNTHPFVVNKKLAFVHNGIISGIPTTHNEFSDTWHFNEQIIKPIIKKAPWIFDTKAIQTLIADFIGFSKLIFMDSKGKVTIFNEDKGTWDNDCWFSNRSYERKTYLPKYVTPAPAPDTTPPRIGDVVFTVTSIPGIPVNTYGSVTSFGAANTAWVRFYLNGMDKAECIFLPSVQRSQVYKSEADYKSRTKHAVPDNDPYDSDLLMIDDAVLITRNYGPIKQDDVGIIVDLHKRAATVELNNGNRIIVPKRFLQLSWGN